MKYTIYQIRNIINNKIYIGKHQTLNPEDDYFGSGKAIVNAIKKYGRDSFIKEVLYVFNTEIEMNNKEKVLITEEFVKRTDTYNLGVGGEGGPHFKGKKHSDVTLQKLSNLSKGRKHSNERKKQISEQLRNRPVSDETRKKISESIKEVHRLKKLTQEGQGR